MLDMIKPPKISRSAKRRNRVSHVSVCTSFFGPTFQLSPYSQWNDFLIYATISFSILENFTLFFLFAMGISSQHVSALIKWKAGLHLAQIQQREAKARSRQHV